MQDVREDLRYSMAKDVVTIKNEILTIGETCTDMESSQKADEERSLKQIQDLFFDFQKKVTLNKHEKQYTDTCSSVGNPELHRLLLGMYELWNLNSVHESRALLHHPPTHVVSSLNMGHFLPHKILNK